MTDLAWGDYLPAETAPLPIEPLTMAEDNWDIEAVVLIIDRRTCACGRHFDTPNPRVMVRKRRHLSQSTLDTARELRLPVHQPHTLHFERLTTDTVLPYDVPRETEYINSRVDACQGCFRTYSPVGQFELFPKAKPSLHTRKLRPTGIRPLGVEDFL